MRQNSMVKHMQRVPHVHTFRKGITVKGRDVCDNCPFHSKRRKSLGTKREAYDFEAKRLLIALLPKKTNEELRTMILNRDKNAKVSKMKKADLVSTLVGMVK